MAQQIVQISDTHISESFPQRTTDLQNCVAAINALPNTPALVVHTGDIAHDGLEKEYSIAKQQLDQLACGYVVMAGNRDDRIELNKVFTNQPYQLTDTPFVQYSVDDFSVRLIMLDTVSTNSNKGRLCAQRLSHLESMLKADDTKPVKLFLHHPPYEATGIPDPYQYEDWSEVDDLETLLASFSNIGAMYCGHVHRYIDGDIGNIEASAITCLAGDLRKGKVTDDERKNPVFKVIDL